MKDRFEFILSHIHPAQRVLNIGCCGNPWDKWHRLHTMIEHRLGGRLFLHGVDLWKEGTQKMRGEGYCVYEGDAEDIDRAIPGPWRYDVVVAGELIEHLTRPGRFLEHVKQVLNPGGKLIITTPNSWAMWPCILYGVLQREEIHPEHVSIYNEDCLKKMLARHGYDITCIDHLLQESEAPRRHRFLKEIPERIFPRLRPIVGAVASVSVEV